MSSILIVEDEVLAFRRQATKRSQPAVRKKHKLMLDRESNRIPPAGARLLATGKIQMDDRSARTRRRSSRVTEVAFEIWAGLGSRGPRPRLGTLEEAELGRPLRPRESYTRAA